MINVVWIDDLMGHLFTLNQDTITQNYRDYPYTALYDKAQLGARDPLKQGISTVQFREEAFLLSLLDGVQPVGSDL